MSNASNEAYKRITGRDMPKPWAERTEEDKLRAQQEFIASVHNASPEEDAQMDEFIAIIQKNLRESRSLIPLTEDRNAA